MKTRQPQPFKIAIMRYRFVGDTLLTIPFLRALRAAFPQAQIEMLVGQDGHAVMAQCPYLDNAIVFEPRQLGFWGAVNLLRQQHYNRVYVLKRSFSSALMAALAGIPQRIGLDTEYRGFLLTRRVPYRHDQHEAQCFLDTLPEAKSVDNRLAVWLPPDAEQAVLQILQPAQGPKIVLHATSHPAKCWPLNHYQALATRLAEAYNAQLYLMGVANEAAFCDRLMQGVSPRVRAAMVNICGQTTLLESLALLKHMDLVVASDSGMIHMAAAVNTPLVAIFGPTDPQKWRPLSENNTIVAHPTLPCRPCRMKITCNHQYPCLTEIEPEVVFDACKTYLTSWSGLKL